MMIIEYFSDKLRWECSDLVKYNGMVMIGISNIYLFLYPVFCRYEAIRLHDVRVNLVLNEANINDRFLDLENQL